MKQSASALLRLPKIAIVLLCVCVGILWAGSGELSSLRSDQQRSELLIDILDHADGGLTLLAVREDGAQKRVDVDRQTASRLAAVRFTIECAADSAECMDQRIDPIEEPRELLSEKALAAFLTSAGRTILDPLASEIRTASRLNIRVPSHLIKIAIDVLEFDGEPLYVHLPVVYTVGQRTVPAPLSIGPTSVGVLISDKTADPDRAVFEVARIFPRSRTFDVADFTDNRLPADAAIDFAIISAHGRAGYEDRDVIALNDDAILHPATIARHRPQLVYLDSCNLGISLSYLEAMRTAGVKYLLAPIVSNEAGNSSTLTMTSFFREIAAERDPVTSLHIARVRAYEAYGRSSPGARIGNAFGQARALVRDLISGRNALAALRDARVRAHDAKELDRKTSQLWRAFPFRIYALN